MILETEFLFRNRPLLPRGEAALDTGVGEVGS